MFELFLKIIFFPIWFPIILVISILSFVIALSFGILGFAFFLVFAVLILSAVIITLVCTINLFVSFFTSLMGIGISLMLLGFSLIVIMLGTFIFSKIIPNLYAGISTMFEKMFSIKKKNKSVNQKEIVTYEKIN